MIILIPMHIGKNLRELRKKAGLTQAQLAKSLGVKQQVIASYEKGLSNPEVAKLPVLAKALGISIAELFQEEMPAGEGQKIRRKNSRDIQAQEVFRKLKPEEQRTILKHMRALAHVH